MTCSGNIAKKVYVMNICKKTPQSSFPPCTGLKNNTSLKKCTKTGSLF